MRLEKSEHLLHLAMMMQASTEGISLFDIQEEFTVGRRTAERMRDAIFRLFPQIEENRLDDKTKRWRILHACGAFNFDQIPFISARDFL